ncbi:MAG: nuclear transport factor 2 family protein [Acidobacteriia bacterium]|nr:nuclear transport factor 2 family protein [Terriglobia bacterium]
MKIHKLSAFGVLLAALSAGAPGLAQPAPGLTLGDRNAIQALMTQYAQALSGCRAAEFADLFVPETGYFASGFRGRMVGGERLIALVESERQCVAPAGAARAPRPGGAAGPTVELEVTASGVRGIAKLGGAEYQDEYVKTPEGWRFASRTVIVAAEKAAGLEAPDMLAIQRLSGAKLGDHYEADANGITRLMTSGVKVSVSGGQVTGRVYLQGGGYDDQVYEKLGPGSWRVTSTTHGAQPAK